MKSILIVDDESNYRENISVFLKGSGFSVTGAACGQEALACIRRLPPDLILLDINMPAESGMSVCEKIKRNPASAAIPVIFLTASSSETDMLDGLGRGADDYVCKTASIKLLIARINIALRHSHGNNNALNSVLHGIALNHSRCSASYRGAEIALKPKEFHLLSVFLLNSGKILPRDYLLDMVWGTNSCVGQRTVDTHVAGLRAKLLNSGHPGKIRNVHGTGYEFQGATT